jgi:hypothetical protein
VQDIAGNIAIPVSYTINIAAGANGVNNDSLNGDYTCLLQGSIDIDDSRWATILNFQADGQGNFSNGIFDTNSHDIGSASGIVSGSYIIGSDNNGTASIHTILTNGAAGIQTLHWAIALSGVASPAEHFRMVEDDDLGTLPSGQQGTANCYQATASAFAAGAISGNSFVFGLDGEENNGTPKAAAGLFTTAGGIVTSGYIDSVPGGSVSAQSSAFTGSYTTPDPASGRFTIAPGGSGLPAGFTVYIIDANRMFILDNTSDSGEQAGSMRTQQQSTYSGASLAGPFVYYLRGADINNNGALPSGFYSSLFQGGGDGAGNLTLNQSYMNQAGTYTASNTSSGPIPVNFDPLNPGRATFQTDSGMTYLYLFNTNSALEMSVSESGSLDSGWMEPQTQTAFTNAALAGNYLFGDLPLLNLLTNGSVGDLALSTSGAIQAAVTNTGQGFLSWDQAISTTYAWDATAPGAGSFLAANGPQGPASCAVITPTKFACISQTDPAPSVQLMEQ